LCNLVPQTISMVRKYACCKHGPAHLQSMPSCGFAHRLNEVELPDRINPRMWHDLTGLAQGPAGIDFFIGQELAPQQLDRICALVSNEGLYQAPPWVRLLFWFRGFGYDGEYVLDSDFGWQPTVFEAHCEYFQQMLDDSLWNIAFRIRCRMASAATLPVYICRVAWRDIGDEYRDSTTMFWGAQSQQYLSLAEGRKYCRVGVSDCQEPWWYVVRTDCVTSVLTQGGWVPPAYLECIDETITVHEMPVLVLDAQDELFTGIVPAPLPPMLSDEFAVYCDGSCNAGLGIAAGWSFQGKYFADRASLAGAFQGSEASELLGIVGALALVLHLGICFTDLTLRIDSQRAFEHVFHGKEPSTHAGSQLYPAISLARFLVNRIRDAGVCFRCQKVPRELNLAHCIAKHEQRKRLETGWLLKENKWPSYMAEDWVEIFRIVARNQEFGLIGYPVLALTAMNSQALNKQFLKTKLFEGIA
jgi:hypothetical protein